MSSSFIVLCCTASIVIQSLTQKVTPKHIISYFTIMYSESLTFLFWITQFKVLLWGTPSLRSGMCICFLSVSGGVCTSWICFLYLEECVMCKLLCSAMVAQTSTAQARIQQLLCMTGRQGSNELVVHLLGRPVEVVSSSRGKLHTWYTCLQLRLGCPLLNVPWSFPFPFTWMWYCYLPKSNIK